MLQETKINPSPNISATGKVKYIPSGRLLEQKQIYIAKTTSKQAIAMDLAIILKLFPDKNPLARLK